MSGLLKKFIEFKKCERIWAIGSIHGNLHGIRNIHKYISDKFIQNDKLIYLGNVIGVGESSTKVINEINKFRLFLIAKYTMDPESIIFLRGAQEEMLSKLLELQTSPNPQQILLWMFSHGVDKTLLSYDLDSKEILKISDMNTFMISRWTTKLKNQISLFSGHNEYYANLSHAAFADTKKILFVNRGVDISRPLAAQNDCFWWGYHGISNGASTYHNFIRIVRGYDPKKTGPNSNNLVCSLYKGSGFGENVIGGLFSGLGHVLDLFEA